MTCDTQKVNVEDLIKWLQVMAENLETAHPSDLYFEGAAKSYRNVIHVIQIGLFDTDRRSQKE